MIRACNRFFLPALAVLLGAASARANPVAWTFDSTKSTFSVTGDPGNLGGVSFAALSGSFSGDQTIPILNVVAATSPAGSHTDTYSGAVYNAIVDLTDATSGDLGEFDFTGRLSGTVSPTGASLSSTFDDPQTVHHTLGGHDYAVTIGPFASPSASGEGGVTMSVAIDSAVGSPPPVDKAPEPSGVVLGATAACIAGVLWWGRRRQPSALGAAA